MRGKKQPFLVFYRATVESDVDKWRTGTGRWEMDWRERVIVYYWFMSPSGCPSSNQVRTESHRFYTLKDTSDDCLWILKGWQADYLVCQQSGFKISPVHFIFYFFRFWSHHSPLLKKKKKRDRRPAFLKAMKGHKNKYLFLSSQPLSPSWLPCFAVPWQVHMEFYA